MAGVASTTDPRGARWEARLRKPVLTAAWLAVPTVFLYFSKLEGTAAIVAVRWPGAHHRADTGP